MGMMILGLLLFVLFTVLAVVIWIVESVKRLLGLSRPKQEVYSQPNNEPTSHPQRKKIIGEDEGEYVDFEEVK